MSRLRLYFFHGFFSSAAWKRGEAYQREGRAKILDMSRDGTHVKGRVSGNRSRPYRVHLTLGRGRHGKPTVTGGCDCPVGMYCKHMVALLVQGWADDCLGLPPEAGDVPVPVQGGGPEPSSGGEQLDSLVANWLQTVEQADQRASEAYPDSIRQRLVYVLSEYIWPIGTRETRVEILATRLLKDGTFSKSTTSYSPSQIKGGKEGASFLRPSDRRILGRLEAPAFGHLSLKGEAGAAILEEILATGRACWENIGGSALVRGEPREGRVTWRVGEDGRQSPRLEPVNADGTALAVLPLGPPWLVSRDPDDPGRVLASPVEAGLAPGVLGAILSAPPLEPAAVKTVRSRLAGLLGEAVTEQVPEVLPRVLATPREIQENLVPCLRIFALPLPRPPAWIQSGREDDWGPLRLARCWFRYAGVDIAVTEKDATVTRVEGEGLLRIVRNRTRERQVLKKLKELGFKSADSAFGGPSALTRRDDLVLLSDDDDEHPDIIWVRLLLDDIPRLREEGWHVEVDEDFPVRPVMVEDGFEVGLDEGEGSGIDWFDLNLGVLVDGERVDLLPALLTVLDEIPTDVFEDFMEGLVEEEACCHVRTSDGRILVIPFERLRPLLRALLDLFGENGPGAGRLSLLESADLATFEEALAGEGVVFKGGEAVRALGRRLRELGGGTVPKVTLPDDFKGTLRPYQVLGVAWMQMLRETGLGGILADDMGLGKTVQALAHLSIEKAEGRLDRPSLLIAPTSLMGNWRAEAARFAPDLRTLVLQGPDRKASFDRVADQDLVLSTYPLLARDAEVLAGQEWYLLILDEAQTVKNPRATTAKTLGRLSARHRLALTGTPVENNLGDLWALYNAVSPGLLGDRKTFTKRWRTPIEKHGDVDQQGRLSRRLRPFLLRRSKDDVLVDLPPLTDIVEHVSLEGDQRAVYEAIRLAMHRKVRAAIARKGLARSHIDLLEALLRLRQVCCDPRLIAKADLGKAVLGKAVSGKAGVAGSAKMERLLDMLPELVAEGRRILLFSQFTSMLDLIETAVADLGIPHVMLTGKTRERETVVNRFQAGEAPLFLISLKAGGTGLNLTAADTVIHYDPWWNPAVERQATDRAHRIGQDKSVFVHRLIAEDTIEVKMQALKDRKKALAEGLYDAEGATPFDISEDDIEFLLGEG